MVRSCRLGGVWTGVARPAALPAVRALGVSRELLAPTERGDGWEWPRAYADDDIEGFFDEEDEEDPDEFSAFDDPYLVDEWEDAPDEEVHEAVLLSLASDGFLDARNIRVEVRDRVVTLRGEVGDYMEARYAWDDAWDAPGVRGVISKLSVAEPGGQEASKVSGTPEAAPVAPTKTLRSTGTGKAAQE